VQAYAQEQCNWKFISAYSPHMGGLWEAGVKATKYHLKRVMSLTILTFEQLYSLIVQIEGILNARPLSPLSQNSNDLTPLTPSHFLIGRSPSYVPDFDFTHLPENRLNLYQHIQYMTQQFWKRWQIEYISELQQRRKWKSQSNTILAVGTLVIIKENQVPVNQWKLGRILQLHPGPDGITRVVTIQLKTGISKRAVTKICALPNLGLSE
jgi:hypothetical protein